MDVEAWEERSAIMEFCGGMTRFQAETEAAKAQGRQRHEFIASKRGRDFAGRGHQRSAVARQQRQDDVPGMQRGAAEEDRPLSERDEAIGRRGLVLSSLRE